MLLSFDDVVDDLPRLLVRNPFRVVNVAHHLLVLDVVFAEVFLGFWRVEMLGQLAPIGISIDVRVALLVVGGLDGGGRLGKKVLECRRV